MSYSPTWQEPFLPWVESENDRRFKRILRNTLLLFVVLGLIIPFLPVPEVEQKELQEVAPRLARLILEKQKAPPPPQVQKQVKKKVDKKQAVKKKKPVTKKQQTARKKAERTGLVALSDELADLRESFDMASLDVKPQQKAGRKATPSTNTSKVLAARASKGSGGINTSVLSRNTGGSQLASRNTTNVTSSLGSRSNTSRRTGGGRSASRGDEEIERVMQKNKGAIYSLYNRALRKDPGLEGRVVLEMTIAPNGRIVKVRIVSSELNSPALERKLLSRVKLIRFSAKDVSQVTVTYPINFLPS